MPRSRGVIDCGYTGLTVRAGATIGWVGEDAIDVSITRPFPNDVAVGLSSGQFQRVLKKPQQRLPHGAKFGEFVEDQSNRLLDASIGVFLKLVLISLQVTDWSGHDQFAAPRFLVSSRKRALT